MVEPLIDEINRRIGDGLASAIPTDARVMVGTEADLAGLESLDLGVVPDVDFLLSGTGYRASEEALRQVARLAGYVGRGGGRRVVVQTRHPDSKLIASLRRGSPIPYLEDVLVERARAGTPPSVEMVAIEVRGSVPKDLDAEIRSLTGVEVLGPATYDRGTRWLLSGDLGKAKAEMRPMIGRWREKGATVRVDADPIDF
jgi:primosomal protein N'